MITVSSCNTGDFQEYSPGRWIVDIWLDGGTQRDGRMGRAHQVRDVRVWYALGMDPWLVLGGSLGRSSMQVLDYWILLTNR